MQWGVVDLLLNQHINITLHSVDVGNTVSVEYRVMVSGVEVERFVTAHGT